LDTLKEITRGDRMALENRYRTKRDEVVAILEDKQLSIGEKLDKLNVAELIQTTDIYQAELLAQNQELLDKEDALLHSRFEFETLFNLAPVGYLELDSKFHIIRYNQFASKFFLDHNLYHYKGKPFSLLVAPSDMILFFKLQNQLVGENYGTSVISFVSKSELYGRIDITKHNEKYFLSIIDVTLEKKQEALLLLQAKKAAMGEMVSMITHQWKQPLSFISILNTGMDFQLSLDQFDKEKFLEYNTQIKEQIDYMSETIDDFKEYFSPKKEKKIFNAKDCVTRAIKFTQASLKKNNITLEVSYLDDGDYTILSFNHDVCQVLMNIINNAKDQFISLNNEEMDKKISLCIFHDSKNIIFELKNNGGVIPEEILEFIFQSNFTTKEDFGGSGIGLYIVEKIITEHLEGSIEVINIKEENSVLFKIKIPVYKEK